MSDQDTTQQLPPPEEPGEPVPKQPKRLLRSRDRVIAGVAGGIGRYFDVDPVIVRIAFAISVFFGGLGAIAYIALALFVPTAPAVPGEEPEPPAVERSRGLAIGLGILIVVIALSWGVFDGHHHWGGGWILSPALLVFALVATAIVVGRRAAGGTGGAGGVVATILIALATFVGLSAAAVIAAWAGATGHGVAVALVVIAIGAMLVMAAFSGGARWLIAPAIALAVPLGAVAAADISFGEGIGERTYRPVAIESLPDDGYELGIGQLRVDLRQLDWAPSTAVDLDLDLGIGEAVVAVPSDVCVSTDFDSRAGDLRVAGDDSAGIDVHSQINQGATATPRLNLTGEVDLGELRVVNDDDADISGPHWHWSGESSDGEMRAALDRACAPEAAAGSTVDPGNEADRHREGGAPRG